MELAKIRNLSDEELAHQEKTSAEQLFRLRFQVSMGQNDGVKKLRELRREIAQIKTIARERELGIHGEVTEPSAAPAVVAATKIAKVEAAEKAAEKPAAEKKPRKTKAATAKTETKTKAKTKTAKAKGARK
jgi:large subunit ribosomal protein L29